MTTLTNLAIRDWPDAERPREKLLQQGVSALSDAELLAVLLRTGVRGKTAVDLGRDLLREFGGLRQVMEVDYERFCQTRGLGLTKYVQFQVVLEIARRYLKSGMQQKPILHNPEETYQFLAAQLRPCQDEVFACLFLDNAHRVIEFEKMFHGTINFAHVHPRTLIKQALKHNAAALILAHNHPSGIAEPSNADIEITRHLKQVLSFIEVRLLDHVVIGDQVAISLAERGVI